MALSSLIWLPESDAWTQTMAAATRLGYSATELAHLAALHARGEFSVELCARRFGDEEHLDPGQRVAHGYGPMHPYAGGALYALPRVRSARALIAPPVRAVLDIGSPLIQTITVATLPDTDVTMLDVRVLPMADLLPFRVVLGTATALPCAAGSVDVVTSSCALCHIGDGRYDDDLLLDGDRQMLAEIRRVLAPGGILVLMAGPVVHAPRPIIIYNAHRIYTMAWLHAAVTAAGFWVTDTAVYSQTRGCFVPDAQPLAERRTVTDYGCLTAVAVA